MPNYPSTIPRLTSVTPLNATPVDVADGGGVRVASLAAIQKYRIDIEHNAITSSEFDELMAFWADYQNQQIALVRADRMVYYAPFVNEPEYKEINGARYNVKVQLDGRRIPSIVPAGYGSFEASPTCALVQGDTSIAFDTSVYKFGAQALKLTKNAPTPGTAAGISLAPTTATYNITIPPNCRWIMALSARQTVARYIQPTLTTGNGSNNAGTQKTLSAVDTWQRIASIIDLSASSQTTAQIRFYLSSSQQAGEITYIDGVSLFNITGLDDITESNFPTVYIPPEP